MRIKKVINNNIVCGCDEKNREMIVTGKGIPARDRIAVLFDQLAGVFEKDATTKGEVVSVLQGYLPEFHHIEAGKSLDSKM